MRSYVIRQSDAEGTPIVGQGESTFAINDLDLIPPGYVLDVIENRPNLKTIFVKSV